MVLYHTSTSSCYIEIQRIRYESEHYIKADINWYTKPGKTLMSMERNIKIYKKTFLIYELDYNPMDSLSVYYRMIKGLS